jgi:hypothetical protein
MLTRIDTPLRAIGWYDMILGKARGMRIEGAFPAEADETPFR